METAACEGFGEADLLTGSLRGERAVIYVDPQTATGTSELGIRVLELYQRLQRQITGDDVRVHDTPDLDGHP